MHLVEWLFKDVIHHLDESSSVCNHCSLCLSSLKQPNLREQSQFTKTDSVKMSPVHTRFNILVKITSKNIL